MDKKLKPILIYDDDNSVNETLGQSIGRQIDCGLSFTSEGQYGNKKFKITVHQEEIIPFNVLSD